MRTTRLKLTGILFLVAGIAFIASYLWNKQVSFLTLAVTFLILGSTFIGIYKRTPSA